MAEIAVAVMVGMVVLVTNGRRLKMVNVPKAVFKKRVALSPQQFSNAIGTTSQVFKTVFPFHNL